MTDMSADFLDAHQRHWADADLLFQQARWANADHLYGLAAECGLKKLMLAFGMAYDSDLDRPAEYEDRVHADGIWRRFESYRSGRCQGTAYTLGQTNPFADWSVHQRYAGQSNFDQERATRHQVAAQLVCKLVKQAQLDGLL